MTLNIVLLVYFLFLTFFSFVHTSRCIIGIIGVILIFFKIDFGVIITMAGLLGTIIESLKFMNLEYNIQNRSGESKKSFLPYLYATYIILVSITLSILVW